MTRLAAVTVQTHYRGLRSRRRVLQLSKMQTIVRQMSAVVLLQRKWRKYCMMKEVLRQRLRANEAFFERMKVEMQREVRSCPFKGRQRAALRAGDHQVREV